MDLFALKEEPELGHHSLQLKDDDEDLLEVDEFLVLFQFELLYLDGGAGGQAFDFYVLGVLGHWGGMLGEGCGFVVGFVCDWLVVWCLYCEIILRG